MTTFICPKCGATAEVCSARAEVGHQCPKDPGGNSRPKITWWKPAAATAGVRATRLDRCGAPTGPVLQLELV